MGLIAVVKGTFTEDSSPIDFMLMWLYVFIAMGLSIVVILDLGALSVSLCSFPKVALGAFLSAEFNLNLVIGLCVLYWSGPGISSLD